MWNSASHSTEKTNFFSSNDFFSEQWFFQFIPVFFQFCFFRNERIFFKEFFVKKHILFERFVSIFLHGVLKPRMWGSFSSMDKKNSKKWKKTLWKKKKTVFVADAIKSVSSCLWSIILSAWSVQSFIISIVLIMREESKSTKYIKECICAVKPATFFNYETGEAVKIINQRKKIFFWLKERRWKKTNTRREIMMKVPSSQSSSVMYHKKTFKCDEWHLTKDNL